MIALWLREIGNRDAGAAQDSLYVHRPLVSLVHFVLYNRKSSPNHEEINITSRVIFVYLK